MPHSHTIQAIILAGAGGSRLYPLNSQGMPKVLMPVANRPLLTFPLRMLEEGGIKDVLVVGGEEREGRGGRGWGPADRALWVVWAGGGGNGSAAKWRTAESKGWLSTEVTGCQQASR